MKNEPPYSLAALKNLPNQSEPWVGVRNREARNMMQYGMKIGDEVLYYNASIANPHIAGIARVCSDPQPDLTAFDSSSPYYDRQSDPSNPTWYLIHVKYEREFTRPVYLAEMRLLAERGMIPKDFTLFRRNRLSIHPLTPDEFNQLVTISTTPLTDGVILKAEKATVGAHPSRQRKTKTPSVDKTTAVVKKIVANRKRKTRDGGDDEDDEDEEV